MVLNNCTDIYYGLLKLQSSCVLTQKRPISLIMLTVYLFIDLKSNEKVHAVEKKTFGLIRPLKILIVRIFIF